MCLFVCRAAEARYAQLRDELHQRRAVLLSAWAQAQVGSGAIPTYVATANAPAGNTYLI